jgi:hypothetical protein
MKELVRLFKILKYKAKYNYQCYSVTMHPNKEKASYYEGYLKCIDDIEQFFKDKENKNNEQD